MPAYYNEHDKYAAQWLRNLISAGHIAPGDVDERSIADVRADDVRGYTQCHWFAGIGIWSAALRQAGWDDARSVWTGSCPCQPLSAAGKRLGARDERHLWPEWFRLICELRPVAIFGEQVASADGLAWLDIVQSDLEDAGYASGAVDLCAAGVGAPHIRQRLWFMAYANGGGLQERWPRRAGETPRRQADAVRSQATEHRDARLLADAECPERRPHDEFDQQARGREQAASGACGLGSSGLWELGNASVTGLARRPREPADDGQERQAAQRTGGATGGFWRDAEWIACTDGKARPVEAGTFPLAHGDFARVGRLRAYGNAINQQVAAEFIGAAMMELPRLNDDALNGRSAIVKLESKGLTEEVFRARIEANNEKIGRVSPASWEPDAKAIRGTDKSGVNPQSPRNPQAGT